MDPKEPKWRADVRRMFRALIDSGDAISFVQPVDCRTVADHIAWLTIVDEEADGYDVTIEEIGDELPLKASAPEPCYSCPPEIRREPSTISAEAIQRHNQGRDR